MRRVPLARRNLLAEPRRLAAGVAGIGLALALILLLGGLWAGIQAQSVQYVDAAGAALWVLPPGTRTLFAEGTELPTSTLATVRATPGVDWAAPAWGLFAEGTELPTSTLATVRATPGVDWAAPAWGLFAILDLHDTKAATVLVGSTPGQPGARGRWRAVAPRPPTTRSPSTGSWPASTAWAWAAAWRWPIAATGWWGSPAMPGS